MECTWKMRRSVPHPLDICWIAGRPPWKDALFGDVGGRRGPPPVHPLGAQVNLSKTLGTTWPNLESRHRTISVNAFAWHLPLSEINMIQ